MANPKTSNTSHSITYTNYTKLVLPRTKKDGMKSVKYLSFKTKIKSTLRSLVL